MCAIIPLTPHEYDDLSWALEILREYYTEAEIDKAPCFPTLVEGALIFNQPPQPGMMADLLLILEEIGQHRTRLIQRMRPLARV